MGRVDVCVRGSPVNPDTQHYIITRQNTFRLYTTPNETEVVYIASPKQCSGGVLMLFLDMISYLAGYLYEFHTLLWSWVPSNIEYTVACKHMPLKCSIQHLLLRLFMKIIAFLSLLYPEYTWWVYFFLNLFRSIHFSESINLFCLKSWFTSNYVVLDVWFILVNWLVNQVMFLQTEKILPHPI